jgi:HEAT repeat protein
LAIAARTAVSPIVQGRAAAAEILAQLGWQRRDLYVTSAEILLGLLECTDPSVVQAAASAFGHRHELRCVTTLTELDGHPSGDVRFAAAFGLSGQDNPQAHTVLIRLCEDSESEMRECALLGLRYQRELGNVGAFDAE